MKVIWEPADLIPGRMVKAATTALNNKSLIGYDPAKQGPAKWAIISLSDGMIVLSGVGGQELIDWLNKSGTLPADDDRKINAALDLLRGVSR